MAGGPIRALTGGHPIRPTSSRCRSLRQPNPGRAPLSEPKTLFRQTEPSQSLEQLTTLIKLLGQARSRMVDGSKKQPLDGRTVETVINPPWYLQVASIDGSLLAFDHPSYGPLAFAI